MLGTIISSVVYGEIRRRTRSVWPAVLLHWMGNTLANGLLTTLVVLVPGRAWLGSFGVEGVLMMGLFGMVGGALLRQWGFRATSSVQGRVSAAPTDG